MKAEHIWTLEEAKEMLNLWKAAAKALASGQVEEYQIGTRRLKFVDIDEILKQIQYFSEVIQSLSKEVNTRNVRRVVFRDL